MSNPGPEASGYQLPEAENHRIFRERIIPQRLSRAAPQTFPVVVFVIGQQGSGKARVTEVLAERLNNRGGFVDVDSDLYKPYHPAYEQLMAESDTLTALYTGADGRAWKTQAQDYVREHKLNAVVQETSQNSESVASSMIAYRQHGFRVEARVLGVPEAMSRQGIINRYHEQVKDRGSGRLTVPQNADASYQGILALADLIDEQQLVDHVAVHRRGEGQPRYSNSLDPRGQWQRTPALRVSIEMERDRPWTEQEATDFIDIQIKLVAELGEDWHNDLDGIMHLALPQIQHTTTYAARIENAQKELLSDADPPERRTSITENLKEALEDIQAANDALDARNRPRWGVDDVGPGIEPPATGPVDDGPERS